MLELPVCYTTFLTDVSVRRTNMPQTTPYSGKFSPSSYSSGHDHRQPVEENYGGLQYRDNKLVSGSLDALVQLLVPTVDYCPDVRIQPIDASYNAILA